MLVDMPCIPMRSLLGCTFETIRCTSVGISCASKDDKGRCSKDSTRALWSSWATAGCCSGIVGLQFRSWDDVSSRGCYGVASILEAAIDSSLISTGNTIVHNSEVFVPGGWN